MLAVCIFAEEEETDEINGTPEDHSTEEDESECVCVVCVCVCVCVGK